MVNHYYQFGWSVDVNELVLFFFLFLFLFFFFFFFFCVANMGFLHFSSTVLFHQVCVVSRPTHTK